jgi:CRISPR/Cas system-associated protein endoribonuclease Cas2
MARRRAAPSVLKAAPSIPPVEKSYSGLPSLVGGETLTPSAYADTLMHDSVSMMERGVAGVAWQKGYGGEFIKGMMDDIKKSITAPPSMMSYARISYMPEMHNAGVMQWPGIPPEALAKVVKENIAPQLIIGMRVDDVQRYSQLSNQAWKPGWKIVTRIHGQQLDKATMKDIREAERFVANCNIETRWDEARVRDGKGLTGIQRFLAMLVRDSLTYDGIAIWTNMDGQGKVNEFQALPAGRIRMTGPNGYAKPGTPPDKSIFAVAVDDTGSVMHTFNRDELVWYVRNARADADVMGYGYPEVELGMRLIQGFTNALDLNVDAFNCLSEDTEVLTNDGWKLFGDIDISVDAFATLNIQTGELEFQKATDRVWSHYDGDMYALDASGDSFMVTPNHRVLLKDHNNGAYSFVHAHKLYEDFDSLGDETNGCFSVPDSERSAVSIHIEKTHYSGMVGCVTVPNSTLYVRRNGKPIWTGNSNSVPNGMLLLTGNGWNQRQLDVVARIWTNLKSGNTKSWALPAMQVPRDGKIEILDLTNIKGKEVYYQDFMNMVIGAFCTIYRFPVTRLGYRISGGGTDTKPESGASSGIIDENDPGLAPLLNHIEAVYNEYLIWSRWPHLQFSFTGKSPKEDAREYEGRSLAMTVDERRVQAGLPPLIDVVDKKYKDMAILLGMAPTDPALSGAFQSMAATLLGQASNAENPGAQFGHKIDPALGEQHGHTSGVRRSTDDGVK